MFVKNPAPLTSSDLTLFLMQDIRIEEREEFWKVSTVRYTYAIERKSDKREVIAFHWEGVGDGATVPYPHIHLNVPPDLPFEINRKPHLPAGRVPVEDVVFFLIRELGVQPTRPDWKIILERHRSTFMKYKTW